MRAFLDTCVRAGVDFLLPPTCGACRGVVAGSGALCAACWGKLTFITPPFCARCGVPFTVSLHGENEAEELLCASCLTDPPAFERARAALVYDRMSRSLIGRFKYHDQTALLPTLLPWLERAGRDLRPGVDLLLPVPLHRWRLWRRKYNQAALLARALAKVWGVPVSLQGVLRTRLTPPQVGLKAEARALNVEGAFRAARREVEGKTLLLIDDVFTTGSTLKACADALRTAGAREVRVLTLARVVQPGGLM